MSIQQDMYDFGDVVPLERVRNAHLCVLGCGAVGCNVVLAALLTGWRRFTLVDFDVVESHNCPRSAGIFHPRRDIGKSKTRLLAQYIRGWDSFCEAAPLEIDVRDLGEEFFCSFDAVVCALDNAESVWHVGELMSETGVPLYRAATNAWNNSVEIIENRKGGACLCCGKDPVESQDLRINSCGLRYMSDVKKGRIPALQISSALCANRLTAEMTRRFAEPEAARGDLRYYDTGRALLELHIKRDPNCACHAVPAADSVPPAVRELPGDVFTVTLAELFDAIDGTIGPGATVYGADDYVLEGVCGRCGARYHVDKPLRRVRESEMHCPLCPLENRGADPATTLSAFTRKSPVRRRTLFSLGFRVCGGILVSSAGGELSCWCFRGDREALMKIAYLKTDEAYKIDEVKSGQST